MKNKFKGLRGFNEEYKNVLGASEKLTVHNMSGGGLIALNTETDNEEDRACMIIPLDVAIKLARFILNEDAKTPTATQAAP